MTLLGKAVFGILFIGGASLTLYLVSNYMKEDAVQSTVTKEEASVATSTAPSASEGKKIPFASFMEKDGSYTCLVSQNISGIESSGKVLIKDKNIKADFSTTVASKTIDTHIVTKDGYSYVWTSMTPGVGNKIKIITNTDTSLESSTTPRTYNGFDSSTIGEYSCNESQIEDTVFELPTTIVFTEIKR